MSKVITTLSFEEWVRYLFDHPVNVPEWYWDEDANGVEWEPHLVIDYTTKLFLKADTWLAGYTDAQAQQGLWFLVSEAWSPLIALVNPAIPLERRVLCIRAIGTIFEQYFAHKCTQHLSHLDEPGAGSLNGVCYMWWDIFPVVGQPDDRSQQAIDAECISVMEKTLQISSIACQESALHGLGHWGLVYKSQCQKIISAFLDQKGDLRPELKNYAEHALNRYANCPSVSKLKELRGQIMLRAKTINVISLPDQHMDCRDGTP